MGDVGHTFQCVIGPAGRIFMGGTAPSGWHGHSCPCCAPQGRKPPISCVTISGVDSHKVTRNELSTSRRNLPHWQSGGSWYFVTFRTNGNILSELARDEVITSILHDNKIKYELSSAVVMPDHVHLLLMPKSKKEAEYFSLGEILKTLKGASARRINSLSGAKGSVWQDEWFDRIMRDEEEWREKHAYILNNAVKAELVARPEDYKWLFVGEGF